VLVIDARELLTSTARVVGVQLGEPHFTARMALITLHVARCRPTVVAPAVSASSAGSSGRR